MSEYADSLLAEYVQWRFTSNNPALTLEKMPAATFLFELAGRLIHTAADPRPEQKSRWPLAGSTPFYQGKHSDVLIVDRLATDALPLISYHDPEEELDRDISITLAIDTRSQYKRNKLPIPLAFGKLALSPVAYKDRVLRVIQTHTRTAESAPQDNIFEYDSAVLISNLNYGQVPQCDTSASEMLIVAHRIEEVSRLLGAHSVIDDTIRQEVT
jgi:hypothetical protein